MISLTAETHAMNHRAAAPFLVNVGILRLALHHWTLVLIVHFHWVTGLRCLLSLPQKRSQLSSSSWILGFLSHLGRLTFVLIVHFHWVTGLRCLLPLPLQSLLFVMRLIFPLVI